MATSLLLQAFIALWRKLLLLRPPKPLRYLLYLWGALRARFFRKPPDENTRGGGSAKLIADRRPKSTCTRSNDVMICASRVPPSAFSGSATPSPLSIPVELPSRPPSVISSVSGRRHSNASFLTPYFFPNNGSRSSHDIGLTTLQEDPLSVERGRVYAQSQPHSTRASSRASSRHSAHIDAGVYTRIPRDRLRPNSVSPHPSCVDLSIGAEPKTSGETAVNPPSSISSRFKDKTLYPTLENDRYERKICLPKKPDDYEFKIPAKTLQFSREGVPPGWTACAHPEGALYFYHETRKIYTDANVCDADQREEVEAFAAALCDLAYRESIDIPTNAEVVLDIQKEENGDTSWSYYYVDSSRRTLFWLQEFDVGWWTSELAGQTSLPHFKHEIERYYWLHVEYFPRGHHLTTADINELIGILIHAVTDQLTSPSSTVLFSVNTLEKMLSMAKEIKVFGSSDETVCMHGRLMTIFAHPRFLNYHGQYGARLNRDQSVHDHEPKARSLLIKALAPALWNAPYVHLRSLESIWIDDTMCLQPWEQFIEKLKDEWQEFTLYATVLLNANVAFLAIPSVDPGSNNNRTAAQIVSYISIVTSTGSIIIALLLIRQYRVKPRETVEEAAKFLSSKTHSSRGMETLATVYSLPYALLMWGMLTFLGAFSLECFFTHDRVAIYTSTVVWFLVGFLILWCIYTAWESEDPLWARILMKMQAVRANIRTFSRRLFSRSSDSTATPEGDGDASVV